MIFTGTGADDTITGTVDGDALIGAGGNDLLNGGEGNDALDGGDDVDTASYAGSTRQVIVSLSTGVGSGAGSDTLVNIENLIGGSGDDILYGDTGSNALFGGDGRDILIGRDGNDTLQGGDGDDAFSSGAGDDILDGGEGIDRAAIGAGPNGITVDLRIQGVAQDTGQGMDTLISIEQLSATHFSDVLHGDDSDNWIWGGSNGTGTSGDDTISGWGGDDLIQLGAAGDHVLDGGDGIDTVSFEGTSPDFTAGVVVSLALQGQSQDTGQGDVTLSNFENLSGTRFSDTLSGDAGDNLLAGHMGADSLSGGDGNDTLLGDEYVVADSHSAGTAGPIVILVSDYAHDTLDGGAGDDILRGGGVDDELIGGTGDDTLDAGSGNNTIDGGDGLDTLDYATAVDGVTVSLALGTGRNSGTNDTISHIENISGSAFNDTLTGDGGDNVLTGGAGNDTLDGGLGIDTVSYEGAADQVSVNLATGTGGSTATGADTLISIERVIGGVASDSIRGGADNDILIGGEAHDVLVGLDGDDTLQGDAGDDLVSGGLGDDVMDGGDGYDRASFSNTGNLGVTVDLRIQGVAQNTGLGMDTLIGIEHISGTGLGDRLIGDDGDNYMFGGAAPTGDDTLSGMGGDDVMEVGPGDHLLDGGDGVDTLALDGNNDMQTAVNVSLALQGQAQDIGNGNGVMTLTNFENLSGSYWNDTLTGDDGANVLAGHAGDNLLSGGGGDDTLLASSRFDIEAHEHGTAGPITIFENNNGGDNTLDGGAGDDTLVGSSGDELFLGGDGDDQIDAGLGEDTIDGGAGFDTVVFDGDMADYENLSMSGDEIIIARPGGSAIVIQGVERLQFDDATHDANRAPTGSDGSVSLLTGAARVIAVADFGFSDIDSDALGAVIVDTLPSTGVLRLDGAAITTGRIVYFSEISDGKLVFTPAGAGSVAFTFRVQDNGGAWGQNTDAAANTLTISVTNPAEPDPEPPVAPPVIVGGTTGTSGNDVATFTPADDSFSAGLGSDTVSGGGGDDWLQGNAGDDTLSGGVGDDIVYGGKDDDVLSGDAGDDNLFGDAGDDTVNGGLGNDSVQGGEGSNYLRGDDGDDVVVGGAGFDNVHGNVGDDTVSGGLGDDWVAGGKDNDVVSGGEGGDIVSGDLGDDVVSGNQGGDLLDGGVGADIVRGGQGEDIVKGGDGDDYVSGDRDADTLSGGAGADLFHTFGDAGVDRVLDFNRAEGDRILLDPGTVYTTAQVGADVVISMVGGGEMTLVGVQLSSLDAGWIFAA